METTQRQEDIGFDKDQPDSQSVNCVTDSTDGSTRTQDGDEEDHSVYTTEDKQDKQNNINNDVNVCGSATGSD